MALVWWVVIGIVLVGLVLLVWSAVVVLRRLPRFAAASVKAQGVLEPALAVRERALGLQRDAEALQERIDGVSAAFSAALHRPDGGH